MGCDIHGFVEIETFTYWDLIAATPRNRNYEFFGIVAGVRNSFNECLAPGRGWPENINESSRLVLEFRDSHSPTWWTLEEMVEFEPRATKCLNLYTDGIGIGTYDIWLDWGRLLAKHYGVDEGKVRFVVNFDS